MDLVLVTITAISLVLAIALGLIVFKLVREERQRSEARVALLAAATAAEPSLRLHDPEPAQISPSRLKTDPAAGELFVVTEAESPWLRRAAVAAASTAVIAAAGYGLTRTGQGTDAIGRAAASQAAPLELLSLQHTQESDGLTISGIVQNPRTGTAVSRVAVTALLFGRDGGVVATGRAGIDYAMLAPGDESPFVIKVPVTASVSRYRVGFRGPDGSVISHVDRRADGNSAHNGSITGSTPWVR